MNKLLIFIGAIFWVSCSVKPDPLRYSVDNCHFCKMTLADDKFGAELVSSKGKVFKFDDIKCMVNFLNTEDGKANNYTFQLVVDYAHQADEFDLVPATDAVYLMADQVQSPMGGNVASFKDQAALLDFKTKWNGTALTWNEVITKFK